MSDLSSALVKMLDSLSGIVDKGFPKLPEKLQKVVVIWLICTLIIVIFSLIGALFAKDLYYIPLLIGLVFEVLAIPFSLWLVGHIDRERKKSPNQRESEFKFVNRDSEKQYILTRHPNYCLIDAPAGYGKSTLLSELAEGFRDGGWQYAHVVIDRKDRFDTLLSKIDDALNLGQVVQNGLNSYSRTSALVHAIKKSWEKGSDSPGLVLLVDFDGDPAFPVLEEFVTDLIPRIQESLRVLDSFRKKRFRVVIAGRYITSVVKTHSSIPVKEFLLSPFNYRYVKESAENFLPTEDGDSINQLAAHTMHLTGGHPDCMQKMIKLYKTMGNSPDDFVGTCREDIWKSIVYPIIYEVRDAIPKRLCTYLDNLSVLRYLDNGLLEKLIKNDAISGYADAHDFADELTSTFLLSREGRLLKDGITRRLLALHLIKEIGPDEFAARCWKMYSICLKKLEKPETQMPEKWALETLYQSLQKDTPFIHELQKRAELRREFFGERVPDVLHKLFLGRNARVEWDALTDALDEDWEFGFTVNYFLREKQYTDEPYQEFLRLIKQYHP